MLFPKNIESKLGFTKIRELLSLKCLSPLGEYHVERMSFSQDFDEIKKKLLQVNEMKILLDGESTLPTENFFNVFPFLKRIENVGSYLEEEELFQMYLSLGTLQKLIKFFNQRKEQCPNIFSLFEGASHHEDIQKAIEKILGKDGKVKPNASKELELITDKIRDNEATVRRKINQIFKIAQEQNWLADSGISLRDERLVLPVLAEHKRKIKGFVHDESSTGQTLFIEPEEVFELNNQTRELYLRKRREIIRILKEIADYIRPHLQGLQHSFQCLSLIDFIRAKALLAIDLKAHLPNLTPKPLMDLKNAFHPLLFLHLQEEQKPIVPLNIQLNSNERICVVSGPNAGGKSVTLKTTALTQYMLQCGLLISAMPESTTGIFDNIFVDIGDEQSIENDLSTYSSHLKSLKHFVNFSDNKTLFFIDELGMGTDPQFGGPIAEGVLNELNQNKALGVVTTHFSNLKVFASNTAGVFNAGMSFDNNELRPLYILEIGKPGSSYAFEISQKIGLNKSILNYARSKMDVRQQDLDKLLNELEREREKLKKELLRQSEDETRLKKLIDENERTRAELSKNKKRLIAETQEKVKELLQQANRNIEITIKGIKEANAEKEITNKLRKQLADDLNFVAKPDTKVFDAKDSRVFEIGNSVKLKGTDSVGEIVKINGKRITVAFGNLFSTIDATEIEIAENNENKTNPKSKPIDLTQKTAEFSSTIDIRGSRGDEAIKLTDKFIDESLLLGFDKIKIIHGKGDGILKKLVGEYLTKHPMVAKHYSEAEEFGGAGATIIQLK